MLAAHSLTREEIETLLNVPLFSGFTYAGIEEISASVRRRTYRRGEVIHHVDDVAGDVFVITHGFVKHRLNAMDGRQLTHSIQGPGQPFGLLSVIDRKRRAGDAVALTDSEILVIDREVFSALRKTHPEMDEYLLSFHTLSVRRRTALVEDLAFLSVPMRLAKVLLAYAQTEPGEAEPGIPAYLNQTELAFLVGSTRESVNQCLKSFMRQGWIGFERRTIRLLDIEALKQATS